MKTRRFAAVLFTLMISSIFLFGCGQGPWKEFKSEALGFTVKFPGKPEINTKTVDVPIGKITTTFHTVNPFLGRFWAQYSVMVFDITPTSSLNFSPNTILDLFKAKFHKEFQVLAERVVTTSGIDGWELELTCKISDSTLRMFMKGNRIYEIMVYRRKGSNFSEEKERFFESFEMQ